jgi:hypothetical protein
MRDDESMRRKLQPVARAEQFVGKTPAGSRRYELMD